MSELDIKKLSECYSHQEFEKHIIERYRFALLINTYSIPFHSVSIVFAK